MPHLLVMAALGGGPVGPFNLFAVNDPVGELRGIFDYMLLPIAVGVLAAMGILRIWAKNIQVQSFLAISVATGTLLTALLYFGLTVFTLHSAVFGAILATMLLWPTITILGPITAGCLVRARHGQIFLPNWAVFSLSMICIVVQIFWVEIFVGGVD